jgi:hypothetical protein
MERTNEQLKAIINQIKDVRSTYQAESLLVGLTIDELYRISKLEGFKVSKYSDKNKLKSKVAYNIIGYKLKSLAIQEVGNELIKMKKENEKEK